MSVISPFLPTRKECILKSASKTSGALTFFLSTVLLDPNLFCKLVGLGAAGGRAGATNKN